MCLTYEPCSIWVNPRVDRRYALDFAATSHIFQSSYESNFGEKKTLMVYEIHRHEKLMFLHIFAPFLSPYFALTDLAGLYLVSNRCSFDVQLNYNMCL